MKTPAPTRVIHVVRCVECLRRFDDLGAFELHLKSTPHERNVVQITTITPVYSAFSHAP